MQALRSLRTLVKIRFWHLQAVRSRASVSKQNAVETIYLSAWHTAATRKNGNRYYQRESL